MAKRVQVEGIDYGDGQKHAPASSNQTRDPVAPDHRVSVGFGPPLMSSSPQPQSRPSSGRLSDEAAAGQIMDVLRGLDRSAVERVLNAVVAEYNRGMSEPPRRQEPEARSSDRSSNDGQIHGLKPSEEAKLGFADLPSFMAAAQVKSASMRVALVAYWLQIVEGSGEFVPVEIGRELATLNMPIDDVDEAVSALLEKGYVTVVPSERSTKRYTLTPQGINAVWEKFE
jgi:hypothetical protein